MRLSGIGKDAPGKIDMLIFGKTGKKWEPRKSANNYYPFGLQFNSYQRITVKENKYLFNGIERQTELDLGWDLAEFRSYGPEIGRWHQIDPKASERESPYVGFANNPIFFADPLGDTVKQIVDTESGQAVTLLDEVVVTGERIEEQTYYPPVGGDASKLAQLLAENFPIPDQTMLLADGPVDTTPNNSEKNYDKQTIIIELESWDALLTALGLPRLQKSVSSKDSNGKSGGKNTKEAGKDQLSDDSRNGVAAYTENNRSDSTPVVADRDYDLFPSSGGIPYKRIHKGDTVYYEKKKK